MLERYIEHNIFRKIYLCEQLFEYRKIDMEQTAYLLGVTLPTIMSDLKSMVESLEYCIEEHWKEKHIYHIHFKKGIMLSELTQFLYGQSYLLKFLSYYFEGRFTSTELSDLEYISLSKVYSIKKTVLDFFKENGYLKDKEIIISEFDSRNILLALVRYTNWEGYVSRNKEIKESCDALIDYVETHFFKRRYLQDERFLIFRGIEIAIGRNDIPISFSEKDKNEARAKPLFQLICRGLQEQKSSLDFQEDDVYYLFYLFNTRNYTNSNMELLNKDFITVFEGFLNNDTYYNELFTMIADRLHGIDPNDFLFKKSFLQFIRTFWADGQVFLPEKIYLLTKEEEGLYQETWKILNDWKRKNGLKIRWNANLVRKFIKESFLTLSDRTENTISEIFIVTENVTKQLFYREKLDIYLSGAIKINSGIYHFLNELPDECLFSATRLVLCDVSKYLSGFDSDKTRILPVSLKQIDFQLQQLSNELHGGAFFD
ncbi:hypothetical protein A5844_001808 [Enterococcus sp. 10A9_DIV0425]|uniref:Mga helix-turn-helix domain-containing protein n=1 Tax=Candidatus Enterococcus wittei TaxID=1987383 RepID=A0A242JY17_9ENTE|nr:hypothetical protein [Enterococcus sp. 10A9_DIV0425]OTP10110.1 hypothetical protein A5844_001808 [Enterococcus sp. 10A9_DIV0425]THE14272.1 hypothetical protein E1H99_05070 [Enterococcus hirae]